MRPEPIYFTNSSELQPDAEWNKNPPSNAIGCSWTKEDATTVADFLGNRFAIAIADSITDDIVRKADDKTCFYTPRVPDVSIDIKSLYAPLNSKHRGVLRLNFRESLEGGGCSVNLCMLVSDAEDREYLWKHYFRHCNDSWMEGWHYTREKVTVDIRATVPWDRKNIMEFTESWNLVSPRAEAFLSLLENAIMSNKQCRELINGVHVDNMYFSTSKGGEVTLTLL